MTEIVESSETQAVRYGRGVAKINAIRTRFRRYLDNQHERDDFVRFQLAKLPEGSRILDAGAGSQRYRDSCRHLRYVAQDFGGYVADEQVTLISPDSAAARAYEYGPIDMVSDIWSMPCGDQEFDAVLCTEVLEHVPYPVSTVQELARVLVDDGKLILTVPSNCLRHFDPFYFTSGFSDRWFETILPEAGLEIIEISPVGDYYRWLGVELARTVRQRGVVAGAFLLPGMAYLASQKPTLESRATMCMGYHVVARKIPCGSR